MAKRSETEKDTVFANATYTGGRVTEYADSTKGLSLAVSPTGTKSWVLRYRKDGAQRRMTLGRYPKPVSLKQARELSESVWVRVRSGEDPARDKKLSKLRAKAGVIAVGAQSPKVRDVWSRYVAAAELGEHRDDRDGEPKSSTTLATERSYYGYAIEPRFGNEDIRDIESEMIAKLVQDVRRNRIKSKKHSKAAARRSETGDSVSAARATFNTVRALTSFAIYEGTLKTDPMAGLKAPGQSARKKARKRKVRAAFDFAQTAPTEVLPLLQRQKMWRVWRILTDSEARKNAGVSRSMSLALRLCVITLQRRAEIAGAARTEFNGAMWLVPDSRTKNGEYNLVPLSKAAQDVVGEAFEAAENSQYLFATARRRTKQGTGDSNEPRPVLPAALTHAWQSVCKAADVKGLTLHGWRHVGTTALTRAGVAPFLASVALSHKADDGSASVTKEFYQGYDYGRERRTALEKWADILADIVDAEKEPGSELEG